jgi:drug/metabolite transporter (DMT)-like permease
VTTPHPPRDTPRVLPFVLAAAILGISVSGPLARLSSAAPLAIAAWRLTLALGVIGLFVLGTGSWREYRTLARRDLAVASVAGAMLALHFWSWIASLRYTSVAASVVLVNLHPVVIVAGSALFLHERPTARQLVGIAIAMLGAVVIGYGDAGQGGAVGADALLGDALAVLGAFTVGVYYTAGRSLRQRLSLWPYVALVYGACLVVVLALAFATGVPLWPQPSRDWLLFAGIAVGPMLLGHTGFNWSLRYVPAYVVSLAILAEPVGATLLAAFLPSIAETPSAWTLAGGAVILAGLVVGTIDWTRTTTPVATPAATSPATPPVGD